MSKDVSSAAVVAIAERKPEKILTGVVLSKPVNFYNIFGDRVSNTMQGISLRWDGEKVIVKHEQWPNDEKWLMPGSITTMSWSNV